MANEGKKKPTIQREKLAGYLYDLSKVTFTALVIGAFLPIFGGGIDGLNILQLAVGVLGTVSFAYMANELLKNK